MTGIALSGDALAYNNCRHCLMCRHVCPVARVTKRETTTPHGWALLIASVERGTLVWDADSVDTLYQCADCGLCEAHCVTSQPLPAAIVAARAAVVGQNVMPASVARLEQNLLAWGNPYHERRPQTAERETPPAGGGLRPALGLFVGDAAHFLRPQAVAAAYKLLGDEVSLLGAGRSSGYLPYALGLWDAARALAQQNVDEINASGVKQVVTLSTADAHCFSHVYPALGVNWPEAMSVLECSEWAAMRLRQGVLRVQPRALGVVTYHDACHTARRPQRIAAARKLVAALSGAAAREMFWREAQATPCGATGGLEFTQPQLAAALAQSRICEARATGAEILLTDDPQCAAHLTQFADGVRVMNVMELLAEQMA